ncbi:MAG: cbb3-type cytochrome oxidase assembly protein CcoS [Thermodesulfobacteriota bacterium]|jgi:cbb3-type cytochrome oxidase maturation protein
MYYLSWIVLVVISLWVSVVGFIWALKSGQFSDQSRARYLPLRDDFPLPPVKNPAKFSAEVYFLLAVLGIGCCILLVVLIMTFVHSK